MRFFVYLWSRRACNFCHDLWQRHMRTLFVGNVAYVVKWICYRKFVACLWPCISGFWWWTHMLIYAVNFAAFTGQLMGYIVFVRLTEVADFKSTSGTSMINPTKIIKTSCLSFVCKNMKCVRCCNLPSSLHACCFGCRFRCRGASQAH